MQLIQMTKEPAPQTEKCLRCGRGLKNPKSREIGMGKTCWRKFIAENAVIEDADTHENGTGGGNE